MAFMFRCVYMQMMHYAILGGRAAGGGTPHAFGPTIIDKRQRVIPRAMTYTATRKLGRGLTTLS